MAFRFFHRAEVRNYLFRLHHHFTKKKDTRTYDFANHTHHTNNRMHLGKVSARRIQFLPYIRHRIYAYDIYPFISQEKEIVHHFVEYPGIFIIQIPLVWVKRSHHKMLLIRQICKIPRCGGREYLRHGLLIQGRYVGIFKEKVTAHILPVALSGLFRPFMILRGMVHHKIHAYVYPFFMACPRQILQVLHRSQVLLHLPEVRNSIPSVGTPLRRFKERHQMDIIHIALLYIIQPGLHAFHIPCKIVDIKHHPKHIVLFIPVLMFFPLFIQRL